MEACLFGHWRLCALLLLVALLAALPRPWYVLCAALSDLADHCNHTLLCTIFVVCSQIQPVDTVKVREALPLGAVFFRTTPHPNMHANTTLHTVQVRLQLAGETTGTVPSPFTVARRVVAEEGVAALYAG